MAYSQEFRAVESERTYFDAVVDNATMAVQFNGTREETIDFLRSEKENPQINHWSAVPGDTLRMMDVDEYLSRFAPEG